MKKFDIAIIGGGIIGLATAMRLAQGFPDRKVIVLEKEDDVALHQTGHNSGVIHAGIYYAPGSQKAGFCYNGNEELRRYCDENGVKYEMCGKLIVATDDTEVPALEELHGRGVANGVPGLEVVGPERLREIEPHAAGVMALWSPNTGIIDYRAVSVSYAERFTNFGGELSTSTEVLNIASTREGVHVVTTKEEVCAAKLINCAGLQADQIARQMDATNGLRILPFRGEFFSLKPEAASMVNGLIYPVPDPSMPFLGVHFTKRIDGTVEAGPNAVLSFAREGYRKTDFNARDLLGILTYRGFWEMSKTHWLSGLEEQYRSWFKYKFVKSLQKLMPEIGSQDIWRPSAGVRAQCVDRTGKLIQDFAIVQRSNSIHVLNAPSPAATASLPISHHILTLVRESWDL